MHRSLRQTAAYFGTIAATQGLSFLLLPVVTNYLSPEVYGEYSLALSVTALLSTFGSSWIRNVSFRLFFEARAAGRTRAFFVSTAVLQACVVSALLLGATGLLSAFGHYIRPSLLISGGLAILTADYYTLAISITRAEQKTWQYCAAEISGGVLRFVMTVAALWAGFRSPSILFLAPAFGALVVSVYATYGLRDSLTGRGGFDPAFVKGLVRFGPASLPFSVAGWGERLMDRVVLDRFLTREIVGIYSANYAIGDRILGGLVQAVFLMAWPDMLRAWTDGGKQAAREAITRALRLYLWLTAGPAAFVVVFYDVLALLLAPEYRGGAGIMPIIASATWLQGFTGYLNRHLELNLKFATLSWIAFGGAVGNLALNLVLVPRLGAQGAALATLGNFVATFVVFWFIRDRELVRVPGETMLNVALVIAAAYLMSRIPISPIGRAAVFVLVYATGAAVAVRKRFWQKSAELPG